MQVSSYRLILERKDSYFKKVIDYVRIELQHDRSRYELIIHGLQQQLDAVKQHSLNTTGKPKLSVVSDEDTPIQSRMNSRTNSTFLWDL
jgi:hypothetical protein